jgi:hypothetical protein
MKLKHFAEQLAQKMEGQVVSITNKGAVVKTPDGKQIFLPGQLTSKYWERHCQVILSGQVSLSDEELRRAVLRYARSHNMFARTVRTMTSVKREAIVEWLEAQNDPRLAAWLPSVTCVREGCNARRTTHDELCALHLALEVERIADMPAACFPPIPNQCDGCKVGDPVVKGLHTKDGRAYMGCQKERYKATCGDCGQHVNPYSFHAKNGNLSVNCPRYNEGAI